jgi:hypothetical protein
MADNKYLKAMRQASEHIEKQAPEPLAPLPLEAVLPPTPPHSLKPARNVGRPPGKRSNPDWEQLTLFIRKDTKRAVLRRLMEEQSGQDLSEVVEQLLAKWAIIL